MTKLKLGPITDDKPVKITLSLPASLYRDLSAYAQLLGQQADQQKTDPIRLIPPMLAKFIASDREFMKMRRQLKVRTEQAERSIARLPDLSD